MAEFDSTIFSEATTYTPTTATLVLTFSDGVDATLTDTVALDPEWTAALFKAIRHGNHGFLFLDGCLPANSPELRPESQHILERRRPVEAHRFQNWLKHKPAV